MCIGLSSWRLFFQEIRDPWNKHWQPKKQIYSLFACSSDFVILVPPQLVIGKVSIRFKTLVNVLLLACLLLSSDRHLSLCWAFVGTRNGCKKKTRTHTHTQQCETDICLLRSRSGASLSSCWDPEEPAAMSSTLLPRQAEGGWRNCRVYWQRSLKAVKFSLLFTVFENKHVKWFHRIVCFHKFEMTMTADKWRYFFFRQGV